jgi:hypothetical protein
VKGNGRAKLGQSDAVSQRKRTDAASARDCPEGLDGSARECRPPMLDATGGGGIRPPPGLLKQPPMQPNQRCGAGAGTTTIVSPPVLPFSPLAPSAPVIPVEPVAPVSPFSAGAPVIPVEPVEPVAPVAPVSPLSAGAPDAPCGPAGPGTGTATTAAGAGGATTVARSHALNASADNAAATTIEYLMMILPMCRTRTEHGIVRNHPSVSIFCNPSPALTDQRSLSVGATVTHTIDLAVDSVKQDVRRTR